MCLCIFSTDDTNPETPFVKYIVKKTGTAVSFPQFDFNLSYGNTNIENEIDENLEADFLSICETKIIDFVILNSSPKYQGYLVHPTDKTQIYAFFEVPDETILVSNDYMVSVLNELFFINNYEVSDIVKDLFSQNDWLLHYTDANGEKMETPYHGFMLSKNDQTKNIIIGEENSEMFSINDIGEGYYFTTTPSSENCKRFALFTKDSLYLLDDQMIKMYIESRGTDKPFCENNSIYFKLNGTPIWFIRTSEQIIEIV